VCSWTTEYSLTLSFGGGSTQGKRFPEQEQGGLDLQQDTGGVIGLPGCLGQLGFTPVTVQLSEMKKVR
jgi:hypothetical protein